MQFLISWQNFFIKKIYYLKRIFITQIDMIISPTLVLTEMF